MKSFEEPFKWLFIILGLYLAFMYLPLSGEVNLLITRIFRTGLVGLTALGFFRLASNYNVFAEEMPSLVGVKLDEILIPFLTKVVKFVIIVLALM